MAMKAIEISVQVPEDISWDKLTELEDGMSEAAGEVLREHGLARQSHTRRVEADYTERR